MMVKKRPHLNHCWRDLKVHDNSITECIWFVSVFWWIFPINIISVLPFLTAYHDGKNYLMRWNNYRCLGSFQCGLQIKNTHNKPIEITNANQTKHNHKSISQFHRHGQGVGQGTTKKQSCISLGKWDCWSLAALS